MDFLGCVLYIIIVFIENNIINEKSIVICKIWEKKDLIKECKLLGVKNGVLKYLLYLC